MRFFFILLFSSVLPCALFSQWIRQYPLEKLEDVLDLDVGYDGHGFAAGTNDLMLRLDPETNTWELLEPYGEKWRLESVDYMDGSGGNIAAVGGPELLLTMDKGENWTSIPGAPQGINVLKLFSPTFLIAIADGGAFKWENDQWTDLNLPVATGIKGGVILDEMHIWVYTTSLNPAIYYTTNGGQNWNTNLDIDDIDVVRFYDAMNGIATDNRDVWVSKNGGVSWALTGMNALPNSVNDLAFGTSANVLVGATINAEPTISIDSGKTWMDIDPGLVNQRSYSVAAVSDEEFWIGNDLSSIIHSADIGATWMETSGPERNIVQDIHFVTRNVGFAIGQTGMLLLTFDGGTNWEDISFGNRNYLSIFGLSADDMWIGTNQRILHSADTGATWIESLIIVGSNINDVLAVSTDVVLAVSSSGIIYKTINGGAKWDTVYNAGAGTQLRSVARIDDQRYMVTGFNGTILRSQDQGNTWMVIAPPEAGLQYEQSIFHDTIGWMITSSFKKTMWSTTDAGDNWTPIDLPVDRFWDGVYFITPDTGVIAGRSNNEGRAYITFDGGNTWSSSHTLTFPLFGATGFPNPNGTAWIFGYGSDIEVLPYCNTLPGISNFAGDLFPCEGDTIAYSISSENVDNYFWSFPTGWTILGNANSNNVNVLVGANAGFISVYGSNVCGETGLLTFNSGPSLLPSVFNIFGDTEPCPGDTVEFNAITLEADDFLWSFPSGWQVLGNLTDPVIQVVAGNDGGVISMTVSNPCGSDVLMVESTPDVIPDVNVVVTGLTLTLSETGSMYQWYFNGEPIPGATGAVHVATENGFYHALIQLFNGCTTTSDVVNILNVAVDDVPADPIILYPVPANQKIHVEGLSGTFTYSLLDISGRVVKNGEYRESIDVHDLQSGYYVLQLDNGFERYTAKVIRD